MWLTLAVIGGILVLVAAYDLTQRRRAILRNFPIIGHFRYLFEAVGPELRQYIVTNNDEERPFNRDQRRWIYASAKQQNNYFGFGTDNRLEESSNYLIFKHAAFPMLAPQKGDADYDPHYPIACAKVLGGARQRAKAFRPASIINVSAMSYGSLSAPAVESLNRGCQIAGALHNTGEGGVARHHEHGGDLIWQIGTGYFGCRDVDGNFSLEKLKEVVERTRVRAIEIKLSQGAKPGLGGILPAAKITPEIASIRGIPEGKDCLSPNRHTAFHDVDSMLDFVEMIAAETGLPVGIKSAVGQIDFWSDLASAMEDNGRGVDFIAIDGGEGGTGAGPLVFTDHVSLPFKLGMARAYQEFARRGVHDKVVFIGAGRLGTPEAALLGLGLGCDMIAIAREAMIAIGCIQAQRCHSGHCPTGVATQNKWLMRGLDPTFKAARVANYIVTLRKELLALARACGVPHPALVSGEHFDILDGCLHSHSFADVFGYSPEWGLPPEEERARLLG